MSANTFATNTLHHPRAFTWAEIVQQPLLWLDTLARIKTRHNEGWGSFRHVLLSGAGSSAYAAAAVSSGWARTVAIPSTDLLVDLPPDLGADWLVVNFSRSGDSPESAAVISRIQTISPEVRHLAITCNSAGLLATLPGVEVIVLHPRTNDRSVTMTSSFSNLVLAGLCLTNADPISSALEGICARTEAAFEYMDAKALKISKWVRGRVAILASQPLLAAAREASLKILELSAGQVMAMPETYVGLRHGPLTFVQEDTPVLCFVSAEEHRRRYEMDLIAELRSKGLGRLIGIMPSTANEELFDEVIAAAAPDLPDRLRSPFEMVFPQMLAYHVSQSVGLDPDNPSPNGVINRVVQGVRIHD